MNLKTWLLLLVALLTGGAAALGVKSIFFVESDEDAEQAAVAIGTETQILVANVDIPAGTELTAQNVRLTLTPESDARKREHCPIACSWEKISFTSSIFVPGFASRQWSICSFRDRTIWKL